MEGRLSHRFGNAKGVFIIYMARVGKIPVLVPSGVQVEILEDSIKITGPKGTIVRALPRSITVKVEDGKARVDTKNSSKDSLSKQGTIRSHIINMITGTTEGFIKTLEMVGAGFRAEVRGSDLVLTIGYSHPVTVTAPEGVKISVEKNIIKVEGIDKDAVGQVAAIIRGVRPPEPYKGKGIKYIDEVIRRKAGKQAAKTTGAA